LKGLYLRSDKNLPEKFFLSTREGSLFSQLLYNKKKNHDLYLNRNEASNIGYSSGKADSYHAQNPILIGSMHLTSLFGCDIFEFQQTYNFKNKKLSETDESSSNSKQSHIFWDSLELENDFSLDGILVSC